MGDQRIMVTNEIPAPNLVSVAQDECLTGYPATPPYSPRVRYPEYAFPDVPGDPSRTSPADAVYGLVREALAQLGLDRENLGSRQWNPLASVIRPHDSVVVKPNLVTHFHGGGEDLAAMVTHGSVVRAVLDYVLLALGGTGNVIVADAPIQSADFGAVTQRTGLTGVVGFFGSHGTRIDLVDLRRARMTGSAARRYVLPGDPQGYTSIDLGTSSFLTPVSDDYRRFRVTCYDPRAMRQHHNLTRHEYLIANSVLHADVVVNLPKLKTHRKVGLTCALKNVVGINGDKDWLPHHRAGAPVHGGDEYPSADVLKALASKAADLENSSSSLRLAGSVRLGRRVLRRLARLHDLGDIGEGSWYGNDTAWRMVLDLNRILLYADRTGRLREDPQRRIVTIVDGVIAGEREGPLAPSPKACGLVLAGMNPVVVDAVAARLAGFDHRCIPLIANGFEGADLCGGVPPDRVQVLSSSARWADLHLLNGTDSLAFDPPAPWRGHVELRHRQHSRRRGHDR